MPPPQKLKVRRPGQHQSEAELKEQAVKDIVAAIEQGDFDTHLPVLSKAIDDRIRVVLAEEGDELASPLREAVEKLKGLYSASLVPVEGRKYRLRGEKYRGAVVVHLGIMDPYDGDGGIQRARVETFTGTSTVQLGRIYKVPVDALVEIPEMYEDRKPEIAAPMCKRCKTNKVDYSGRGRPPSLCKQCQNDLRPIV